MALLFVSYSNGIIESILKRKCQQNVNVNGRIIYLQNIFFNSKPIFGVFWFCAIYVAVLLAICVIVYFELAWLLKMWICKFVVNVAVLFMLSHSDRFKFLFLFQPLPWIFRENMCECVLTRFLPIKLHVNCVNMMCKYAVSSNFIER